MLLQSINLLTRVRIAIIVSLFKDPLSFSPAVSFVAKSKFNLPHSNLIEINNDDALASGANERFRQRCLVFFFFPQYRSWHTRSCLAKGRANKVNCVYYMMKRALSYHPGMKAPIVEALIRG